MLYDILHKDESNDSEDSVLMEQEGSIVLKEIAEYLRLEATIHVLRVFYSILSIHWHAL
jgi:hypothetical protein